VRQPAVSELIKAEPTEGGRMVIPVGEKGGQQFLLLVKRKGQIKQEKIVDVRFEDRQVNRY
jgi:protein-L-isoaspartate O-methyltransferase